MGRYIVKRMLWLIPIMLLISFISYSLMYLSPGDPAAIYLSQGGQSPDPEALAQVRQELGLDKPFLVQFGSWFVNLLHGDLGTSFFTKRPVADEIATLFPNTLALTFLGMAITLVIAIPLGILCATHENRLVDYIVRFVSFVNSSLPGFFAAMLLIYILGIQLHWLPTVSSGSPLGIWMPALTIGITLSASYTRQIRAAIVTELGEDYIQMKRARGIKERVIRYSGALRSVLPSIMTLAGINVGRLLGGTAIIEIVCTYQGIGQLAVNAILNRDYPMMQGYILAMAAVYVLVNLAVDLLHAAMDPRVRNRFAHENGKGVRQ